MKAIRHILFALVGLMLTACGPSRTDRDRLERAEAVVCLFPDSALAILDSIAPSALGHADFRARATIAAAEAAYRQSVRMASDSLLDEAVDYCRTHSDGPRRLRAFYLRGYQNYLAKHYGNAIIDYLSAEQTAKTLSDSISLGLIYRALGNVYYQIKDYNNSLTFHKKSSEVFNKIQPNEYAFESKVILGAAFFNAFRYDDCIQILEPLLSSGNSLSEDNETFILSLMMYSYINKEDFEKAEEYFNRISPRSDIYKQEEFLQNAGHLAFYTGQYSLFWRFKEELETVNPDNPWLSYLGAESEGDYNGALQMLKRIYKLSDTYVNTAVSNELRAVVIENLDIQNQNLIAEKQMQTRHHIITVIVLVLIVLLLTFLLLYLRTKHQAKIDRQIQLIQHLADTIKIKEQEIILKQSENLRLKDIRVAKMRLPGQFDTLAKLCETYYQHQDSDGLQRKIYNDLKSILSKFKCDSKEFRELELFIDESENNLFTRFKQDNPNLNENELQLFVFIVLGFSPLIICTILGIPTAKLYARKTYLKKKVTVNESSSTSEYLSYF